MFKTILSWFSRKPKPEVIVDNYKRYLYDMADAIDNLGACGKCRQWDQYVEKFTYWEKLYADLGYRTISWNEAVGYVGWGQKAPQFRILRESHEAPILYAEEISNVYETRKKEMSTVGINI